MYTYRGVQTAALGVALVFCVTSAHAAIITNLVKTGGDADLPNPEIVVGGLVSGALSYVDRDLAEWIDIPGYLQGADYIKTENDDKQSGVNGEVYSVTLGQDAVLHVFLDQRLSPSQIPAWLTNGSAGAVFIKTSDVVGQTFPPHTPPSGNLFLFDVWSAPVSAGTYNLGAQTGASMYGIAATAIPEPASVAVWSLLGLIGLATVAWRRKPRG